MHMAATIRARIANRSNADDTSAMATVDIAYI